MVTYSLIILLQFFLISIAMHFLQIQFCTLRLKLKLQMRKELSKQLFKLKFKVFVIEKEIGEQ